MTDKRFKDRFYTFGCRFFDDGKELTVFDCEDLLNELYEENQQIRQENKNLSKQLIYAQTHWELHKLIVQELNIKGSITLEKYEEYLDENYKRAKRDYSSQKIIWED